MEVIMTGMPTRELLSSLTHDQVVRILDATGYRFDDIVPGSMRFLETTPSARYVYGFLYEDVETGDDVEGFVFVWEEKGVFRADF
jgi:hypothetical protein